MPDHTAICNESLTNTRASLSNIMVNAARQDPLHLEQWTWRRYSGGSAAGGGRSEPILTRARQPVARGQT